MPTEVIMPKVDMDMEKGKVSVWHIAEGETVEKGAALFDIETDKAAMEVEAPATGALHHILAEAGADVPVGRPIAWIYAEGEAVGTAPCGGAGEAGAAARTTSSEEAPGQEIAAASERGPAEMPAGASGRSENGDGVRRRATPAARRLARSADLELAAIPGSGPRGRIQAADVELFIARRSRAPETPETPGTRTAPVSVPDRPAVPARPGGAEQSGPLHVSRTKGEGPPLVMLHGFAADSMGWRPMEQALDTTRPLIRIDLPCHGRSPWWRIDGFPALVRAVRAAFDALDLDQPVHLLGHSLGGAVALALADVRPRSIASLALIAPAGLGPDVDAATMTGIARASRTESLAPWLKRLAGAPDAISWDFVRAAMTSREDPDMRAAQLDLAEILFPDGTQGFEVSAALDRLVAPTTILWGRRDHVIPWGHALKVDGTVALHLLPECGHIPHVECPALVAGILKRHIQSAG